MFDSSFLLVSLICIAIAAGLCVAGAKAGIRDPFHPLFLNAVYTPGIAGIYFGGVAFGQIESPAKHLLSPYFQFHRLEDALVSVTLLMLIGHLGYLAGHLYLPVHSAAKMPFLAFDREKIDLTKIGVLLIGVALAAFTYFVIDIGGIVNLLVNLRFRAQFTEGRTIWISLTILPLQIGTLLIFLGAMQNWSKSQLPLLIGVFLTDIAVMSMLGGRALILRLILLCAIAFHFRVRKLAVSDLKWFAAAIPILVLYFAGLRTIRSSDEGFAALAKDPGAVAADVSTSVVESLGELSYAPTYTIISHAYTLEHVKLGTTFYDLLVAFIPRSIYGANKPPVDDGIYVTHLVKFMEHKPPGTALGDLFRSSLPPETLGNGFINFSYPGAFLFMALLGWAHKWLYEWAKACKYSVVSCLLLTLGMFQLHLTNLRIVQFGVAVFLFGVLLLPLTRWVTQGREPEGAGALEAPSAG
jgi:hypothetical protein